MMPGLASSVLSIFTANKHSMSCIDFVVDVLEAMFDNGAKLSTKHLVKVPNFIDESRVMSFPSIEKA